MTDVEKVKKLQNTKMMQPHCSSNNKTEPTKLIPKKQLIERLRLMSFMGLLDLAQRRKGSEGSYKVSYRHYYIHLICIFKHVLFTSRIVFDVTNHFKWLSMTCQLDPIMLREETPKRMIRKFYTTTNLTNNRTNKMGEMESIKMETNSPCVMSKWNQSRR